VGTSAAFSIAVLSDAVFFLGGDKTGQGIVYMMRGYQPQRISTPGIESVIRGLDQTLLANARAWVYQQGGHAFYCLNLPGYDGTWCYDVSTGLWHERTYKGPVQIERHRADCSAVAFGKNIVGDYSTGSIYSLDPTVYTDNGTSILKVRTAPHFSAGLLNVFHHKLQLDLEVGVGLDGSGQGTDPEAMLEWSNDGGHTWQGPLTVKIGKIGKTETRAIWRRLGRARDRVYRVSISDPVKTVLIGAELEVEVGAA
jgi:hypothetical protein